MARTRDVETTNRWMLRARDAIDRDYAQPLDIAALARIAAVSEAHFIRTFRATFGEPPHRYLQRRRIERAMALLRDTDTPVTDVCLQVGFSSLGTFSRTFGGLLGESPSAYRRRQAEARQAEAEARRARAEAATESDQVGKPSDPSAPTEGPKIPTCFVMAWQRPSSFGEASQHPARLA
jgi:AraC-like DNA-binding protein